jgi:glycosyltransferase involved in cell wall biosynthesis
VDAVLHYVERWLPLSAGFVHDHVTRTDRPVVVVSRERLENRAAYPDPPVTSLAPWLRRAPRWLRPDPITVSLVAIAVRRQVSVVHAHFGYVAPEVVGVCRRLHLPLVVSLHGHDATAFPRERPAHYDRVIAIRPRVVVPSEFLADAVERLGFDRRDLIVQGAGIDVAQFMATPLPSTPSVAYVGRLVPKKGLDVLLEAWPEVVARRPDATLHVVGDGPLAPLLAAAPPSVTHERPDPARRREQVSAALRRARVVVTPSRTGEDGDSESLLIVNLEAQSMGRALVTTRHGGIPEFVRDGETALLVPEGDAAALAGAMTRLLDDDALCRRLAAAGPAQAARFDVSSAVTRINALYDEVAPRRRRGR